MLLKKNPAPLKAMQIISEVSYVLIEDCDHWQSLTQQSLSVSQPAKLVLQYPPASSTSLAEQYISQWISTLLFQIKYRGM